MFLFKLIQSSQLRIAYINVEKIVKQQPNAKTMLPWKLNFNIANQSTFYNTLVLNGFVHRVQQKMYCVIRYFTLVSFRWTVKLRARTLHKFCAVCPVVRLNQISTDTVIRAKTYKCTENCVIRIWFPNFLAVGFNTV